MSEATLTAGLVQRSTAPDSQSNLDGLCAGAREAAGQGARLVLLPELHNGPYPCQNQDPARFDQAETIPGPTTDVLGKLAAQLRVVIVASIFERRGAGVYHNTAAVLDSDGTLAGIYRKMHIPDDPGYHEKFYFTPGDTGFTPVKTQVGKLGVLVCWDQWYPEAARLMALHGADVLLYPTAIGWDREDAQDEQQRQLDAWQTVQRGHAIANALPLMCCNRTGFEAAPSGKGGIEFWGSSFIAGPQGEMLAQAPVDEPEILVAELPLARSESLRRIWPFLRDRRIDAYGDLSRRYGF